MEKIDLIVNINGEMKTFAVEKGMTALDALEKNVADSRWPLPKYRDMLFLY